MWVRNIAVPVLVFVIALVQNAGLVSESIDTVGFVKLLYALYRIILNAGVVNVMAFQSGELDKRSFWLEPRFSLTAIVSTKQPAFPVVKINHKIVINPADNRIRRKNETIFRFVQCKGSGKLLFPFNGL